MKRFWLGFVAVAALSACSDGNPFTDGDTGDGGDTGSTIPETIASDLTGFSYDPVSQTLIVRGVGLDDTPFEASYRRRPALDVPGYEAYTSQDGSLDRHTTAFVRQRDGVTAGAVMTGGQFGYIFGGGTYGRNGSYDPPTSTPSGGLVSYAGNYVGLLNTAGDGGDLLPVAPGTPNDIRPVQAAEITGDIFINADFTDNRVNGRIYNRVIADSGQSVVNLDLAPTGIQSDGTFTGDVTVADNQDRGDYGGVFGGRGASAVGGALTAADHIGNGSLEFGAFVLSQCGSANADPVCDQPVP